MPVELNIPLLHQFALLLLIALPVACASWTVTHEEVFREPREFCKRMSQKCKALPQQKFFYVFTCEYCFSHYASALALWLFRFRLLYAGWRGYLVAWFAVVWIANVYMSVFNLLRLDIKHENVAIAHENVAIAVEQSELRDQPAISDTKNPGLKLLLGSLIQGSKGPCKAKQNA